MKIDKLISRIELGDIKIPDFQRGYVWKKQQVLDLLDSIYKDFPIGSILFWESHEILNSVRNIAGVNLPQLSPQYPVNYVLDGQQRLSSIYAVFKHGHSDIEYEDTHVGISDHSIFNIYFDLENEKFVHYSQVPSKELIGSQPNNTLFNEKLVQNKGKYFKLSELFDIDRFFNAVEKLSPDTRQTARKLQSKFINYEVPIVTIRGRETNEVGVIFERINNTGTELNTLDLLIAWTWTEDFNLRSEIKAISDILHQKDYDRISEKVILQCLSAIVYGKVETDTIFESLKNKKTLKGNLDILTESLKRSVDFLRREFKILSTDFLPSQFQIIPLVYYFSKKHTPSNEHLSYLKKWFWRTSFTTRYRDSTDDKVHIDLKFIDSMLNGNPVDFIKYRPDVESYEYFTSRVFLKASSTTKSFILLLVKNNPKSLYNASTIDLDQTLSSYNRKEYHHIFPKAFLKKAKVHIDKINCMANICLLPAAANKLIRDQSPSSYLANSNNLFSSLGSNEKISPDVLKSNYMPTDISIYQSNDFEKFLEERGKLLYEKYQELI